MATKVKSAKLAEAYAKLTEAHALIMEAAEETQFVTDAIMLKKIASKVADRRGYVALVYNRPGYGCMFIPSSG